MNQYNNMMVKPNIVELQKRYDMWMTYLLYTVRHNTSKTRIMEAIEYVEELVKEIQLLPEDPTITEASNNL